MGHYITSNLSDTDFLERGAFNPLNTVIYESLNCRDPHYSYWSGLGTSQIFTLEEIEKALKFCQSYDGDTSPEIRFLSSSINRMKKGSHSVIILEFS